MFWKSHHHDLKKYMQQRSKLNSTEEFYTSVFQGRA